MGIPEKLHPEGLCLGSSEKGRWQEGRGKGCYGQNKLKGREVLGTGLVLSPNSWAADQGKEVAEGRQKVVRNL